MKKKERRRLKNWTREALVRLDNDALIQLCATAFADRCILKAGDLVIENRIEQGAPPGSIELLLEEAGRRGIPLPTLANRVVADAMGGRSFVSDLIAPSSWKRFEVHAAHCLMTLLTSEGVHIDHYEFDARRVGRITGDSRQIDFLIRTDRPKHEVACEFREYPARLIPVKEVEAFASKLRDIRVDKGLLVTPCGYHQGAIATADHYGIVLYRLREMSAPEIRKACPDHATEVRDGIRYWLLENRKGASWVFSGRVTGTRQP